MRGRFNPRYERRKPGTMNKLEEKYSLYLNGLKTTGEIIDYRYEAIKLRLADKTFYTPDFAVFYPDRIELHECKGHWEEDARVKWKVAAEMHWMFKFVAIRWVKKQWEFEYAR